MPMPKLLHFLRMPLMLAVFAAASQAAAAGEPMLADRHAARGLSCASCHDETPPARPVRTEKCLSCHESFEALGRRHDEKKSGNLPNPHVNHNDELYCEDCHHAHSPSVNYCAQCHDFAYKVP